jgi:hypothetical protein
MSPASKPPHPGDAFASQSGVDDAETGVPGFSTWPGVYLFVFGAFIVWVALLTTLSMMFS